MEESAHDFFSRCEKDALNNIPYSTPSSVWKAFRQESSYQSLSLSTLSITHSTVSLHISRADATTTLKPGGGQKPHIAGAREAASFQTWKLLLPFKIFVLRALLSDFTTALQRPQNHHENSRPAMASNILKHLAATSGGNVNQLTNATSSESEDLMGMTIFFYLSFLSIAGCTHIIFSSPQPQLHKVKGLPRPGCLSGTNPA